MSEGDILYFFLQLLKSEVGRGGASTFILLVCDESHLMIILSQLFKLVTSYPVEQR